MIWKTKTRTHKPELKNLNNNNILSWGGSQGIFWREKMKTYEARIKYQRQLREPAPQQKTPPYRIITTDMIHEMFEERGLTVSQVHKILYNPEISNQLTKWMGQDGIYILDDGIQWLIQKYKLRYRWYAKTQGFYTLGASWRDTNGIGRIVRYIHSVVIAKTKSIKKD